MASVSELVGTISDLVALYENDNVGRKRYLEDVLKTQQRANERFDYKYTILDYEITMETVDNLLNVTMEQIKTQMRNLNDVLRERKKITEDSIREINRIYTNIPLKHRGAIQVYNLLKQQKTLRPAFVRSLPDNVFDVMVTNLRDAGLINKVDDAIKMQEKYKKMEALVEEADEKGMNVEDLLYERSHNNDDDDVAEYAEEVEEYGGKKNREKKTRKRRKNNKA